MIQHHPAPDILAEYAGGALHAGAMLVVACHLENCAICRQEAGLWESAGGALLEEIAPEALSQDALAMMMARLDKEEPRIATPALPKFLERFDIPAPLKAQKIGRRHFVTPGIWFAPVTMGRPTGGGATRTYLVHARADAVLAEHSHAGREFTQVLAGGFADDSGLYGEGDFALTDDSITHAPAVTRERECLCLISADAPLQLKGLAARILQRAMGTLC